MDHVAPHPPVAVTSTPQHDVIHQRKVCDRPDKVIAASKADLPFTSSPPPRS